jgi:hypothetical protein
MRHVSPGRLARATPLTCVPCTHAGGTCVLHGWRPVAKEHAAALLACGWSHLIREVVAREHLALRRQRLHVRFEARAGRVHFLQEHGRHLLRGGGTGRATVWPCARDTRRRTVGSGSAGVAWADAHRRSNVPDAEDEVLRYESQRAVLWHVLGCEEAAHALQGGSGRSCWPRAHGRSCRARMRTVPMNHTPSRPGFMSWPTLRNCWPCLMARAYAPLGSGRW